MVELKNWCVHTSPSSNGLVAPKPLPFRLHGLVYGHPNHDDGTEVNTSSIIEMALGDDCVFVRTRNTQYLIRKETIDPWYEQAYPGTYDKIVEGILKNG